MVKYEIIKNGMDNYTLKYKDKEINFHSKVGIVRDLQSINKKARLLMVKDLAEQGMTIQDLVKETKQGDKTIYDNSTRNYIEEGYIQDLQGKEFLKAIEEMLGISLEELLVELEISTVEESQKLSIELGKCLIPSSEQAK